MLVDLICCDCVGLLFGVFCFAYFGFYLGGLMRLSMGLVVCLRLWICLLLGFNCLACGFCYLFCY